MSDDTMNIQCIPYEATMSLAVCESRKKAALTGDGLTNRKCIDCKEGGAMTEEKEVLRCKLCGIEIKAGEKYFKKTMECKKCYQARWLREKKAKMKLASPEAATPVIPEPVKSVKKVKPKPANGNNTAETIELMLHEMIDSEICRLNKELRVLDESASIIRHELAIYEKVRGMLG